MVRSLAIFAALSSGLSTVQVRAVELPMVEWVVPTLPTHRPQTPAEAEEARKSGRKLPPPEVLQPILDPALPSYSPRRQRLAGTFKGAASDVLVVLVQRWFEKFRAYHPEVNLSVSPPYAGSVGATELVKEQLDFVFVSRELRPDDIHDFKVKFGYEPLSVPVCGGSYRHFGALDAVAFFVNKDNPIESSRSIRSTPSIRRRAIVGGSRSARGAISALAASGWRSRSTHMGSNHGTASRSLSANAS